MKENMKKILIVDDDKAILRIFKTILQKQGYTTDTAETGREAEEKTRTQAYDLALIDVKLPDADGIQLLGKIDKISPKTQKIIVTGFASIDDGIKAMDLGAEAYLVKPVKPEELVKLIKQKLKQ